MCICVCERERDSVCVCKQNVPQIPRMERRVGEGGRRGGRGLVGLVTAGHSCDVRPLIGSCPGVISLCALRAIAHAHACVCSVVACWHADYAQASRAPRGGVGQGVGQRVGGGDVREIERQREKGGKEKKKTLSHIEKSPA